ncbi:MAG TPA: hypothetical protein VF109_10850 [Mycobacteriales bacterium]
MRLPVSLPPVRAWAPVTLALRAIVLVTGATALVLAPGGQFGVAGLVALAGAVGLLVSVARPDSGGSAVVLGAAAIAWTVRYGLSRPPVAATLVLAVALALHHQAAALSAALPPTATAEPAVLLRFGLHTAVVLALSAAVAIVALAVGRPGGSVPLELAALVAVAVVTAVPVWLSRRV